MTDANGTLYKLGKKYGDREGYSESLTNLYLSETEYIILRRLPAVQVRKRRYPLLGGSLDVYEAPGLPAIFSVEFPSEQAAHGFVPPLLAGKEVTRAPAYAGDTLARQANADTQGPA